MPYCKSLPVATETGVVANYNLIRCVTIHFQRWKMLVCQKSNVSAYDKCLALRKSWLVMVNISDKDVYGVSGFQWNWIYRGWYYVYNWTS